MSLRLTGGRHTSQDSNSRPLFQPLSVLHDICSKDFASTRDPVSVLRLFSTDGPLAISALLPRLHAAHPRGRAAGGPARRRARQDGKFRECQLGHVCHHRQVGYFSKHFSERRIEPGVLCDHSSQVKWTLTQNCSKPNREPPPQRSPCSFGVHIFAKIKWRPISKVYFAGRNGPSVKSVKTPHI